MVPVHDEGESVSVKIFPEVYTLRSSSSSSLVSSSTKPLTARNGVAVSSTALPLVLIMCPGYTYKWKVMSVALQADGNPANTSDSSMIYCIGLLLTLREGYVPSALDGRHRGTWISQLSAESNKGRARERLSVWLVSKRNKKVLTSSKIIKLSHLANVSSALVHCDTSLVQQVSMVLNYSHMFVEEYGLQFLRAKAGGIVQEVMLSAVLHIMRALTYNQFKCLRKIMRRQFSLLDVLEKLYKGFPSRHCAGLTTMDNVV